MGILARLFVLATIAGAVTGGGFAARRHFAPAGQPLAGIRVGGNTVAAGDSVASVVHARAMELTARHLDIVLGSEPDKVISEATLGDLGVSVDEEATVSRATNIGKDADLIDRVKLVSQAKKGQIDVPLIVRVDEARALSAFESLRDKVDRPSISARIDLDKRSVIPETPGRYLATLDGVSELERIADASENPETKIALTTIESAPRVSANLLATIDIGTIVSEYETYFGRGGDQARRGKNIDTAAAKLDGVVLFPGELVSFNQLVGERSEDNGFAKSWEIYKGEMVEGVGGGTCQVASTFHAAVFFGGLDVLERLPHSRPSAYIPMGLDSTVVYPSVDLKVKNPHPFPLVVHTKTTGNKLVVQLLGREKPVVVGFGRELVETIPYGRKVIEEPDLSGKKVRVKQHGIRGFKIKRSRVLTYKNGEQRIEKTTDTYPPTTEIYAVPPGFDEALLPALPEDPDATSTSPSTSTSNTTSTTTTTSNTTSNTTSTTTSNTTSTSNTNTTPSATPNTTPSATPTPDGATAQTDLTFVDGPGAHAPTAAQMNPAKTIWLRR